MMFNFKGLLFFVAFAGFTAAGNAGKPHGPKNFIFVVPDGFGQSSETMARDYIHWTNNDTVTLPIDEMVIGLIRTRATDSYVTDSAASATAYSCGIKSYNGAIGVDDDYLPCGTVLEAAHLKGMKTGLIVTSRITHATPATFASHVYDRNLESNIALQEIGHAHPLGRTVDLMLGGGYCFFTPNTTANSCRTDDLDVVALAEDLGYTFFRDRKTFDSAPLKLPYIGLFTEDHMSYEIDRNATQEPSLSEMAIKGLNDLNAASGKQGFFVLVEASRIDHAGHSNDPVGHLHDILAYNEAMKAMREWVDEHAEDSPTILISTADHECGGLTVGVDIDGAPEYWFEPQHFVNAKATPGPLATLWKAYNGTDQKAFLKENVFGRYGIEAPTVEEYEQAIELKSDTSDFALFLAHALSARLGVNWASLGHTASDVTLYGWGVNAGKFAGNRENTEVGHFIAQQLGLDLESVQRKLRSNTTWMKEWVMPETVDRKLARRRSLAHHHN